jgi:hypothetical protein
MNATTNVVHTLYQATHSFLAPHFSLIRIPHIKLKAEHQALVLFHVVKFFLTYWEGWRDGMGKKRDGGRKESKHDEGGGERRRRRRRRLRGSKGKVAGRGNYTVVFQ